MHPSSITGPQLPLHDRGSLRLGINRAATETNETIHEALVMERFGYGAGVVHCGAESGIWYDAVHVHCGTVR